MNVDDTSIWIREPMFLYNSNRIGIFVVKIWCEHKSYVG